MKTMLVKYLSKEVQVYIDNGLLSHLSDYLDQNSRYFIVTDLKVASLYLNTLIKQLTHYEIIVITEGEKAKNNQTVSKIFSQMLEADIQKKDYLIALGGGVVSDITAFVASVYKRGINFISIPTTLIAQVDSSLGGKCGVDFSVGTETYKNQIGSIYHPKMIFVDPLLLQSLPQLEVTSGMGEVIKYGLCFDKQILDKIMNEETYENIIYDCLSIKAKITMEDEFDQNIRLALNYGHTIGHALESISKFSLTHGQAVALGLFYETKQKSIRDYLKPIFEKWNIRLDYVFTMPDVIKFIEKDKKRMSEMIKVPILKEIGQVEIQTLSFDAFLRGLQ